MHQALQTAFVPPDPAIHALDQHLSFTDYSYAGLVKQFLPLIGSFEYQAYDFRPALNKLNDTLLLGYDRVELDALSLQLIALARTKRFGGDPHVSPELGENPAVHSFHCPIMATDQMHRANLLLPDQYSERAHLLRLSICRALLVHDFGETLGELTSLAQRAADASLQELPEIERGIFRVSMHLALWATQEGRPKLFYKEIDTLRKRARIGQQGAGGGEDISQLVSRFEKEFLGRCILSSDNQARLARFLQDFDRIEFRDPKSRSEPELFIGIAAKLIERLQGSRYFVRVAHKADDFRALRVYGSPTLASIDLPSEQRLELERSSIPASLMSGIRIKKGLAYMHEGLGELWACATCDEDRRLARVLRNAVYETTIEWLYAGPKVVDLSETMAPVDMKRRVRELRDADASAIDRDDIRESTIFELTNYRDMLVERHIALRQQYGLDAAQRILPVETRARLASLHWMAIQRDYFPEPGQVLALLEDLPHKLRPLTCDAWHAFAERSFGRVG